MMASLTQQIEARIRCAGDRGEASGPADFQIRVAENGAVLINLKTRIAELIVDESEPFGDGDSIAQ